MKEEVKVGWKDIIAMIIAMFELIVPYLAIAMATIGVIMFIFSKL